MESIRIQTMLPILFKLLILPLMLVACNSSDPRPHGTQLQIGAGSKGPLPEIETPGEDPLAAYAWHLSNQGQSSFARNPGVAGQDHGIDWVHRQGVRGRQIRIAVSDSGVEVTHPDLRQNELVSEHRNYSSNIASDWHSADPYPTDLEAHGTAVSGIISAEGWNGIGSRGVAPESSFAAFYFLGNFFSTLASYEAKTIDQMNGEFDIFNYSYGYSGCRFHSTSKSITDAYRIGTRSLRNGKGAIYVKAAGNDFMGYKSECRSSDRGTYLGNTNTNEDQNVPDLILVGALNARGRVSSYSTPGSGLWISAAGGEHGTTDPAILTTDLTGCVSGLSWSGSQASAFNNGNSALNPNCSYTHVMNGTSSAAPVISGIVALMLEVNPELSWRDVKHILALTADKIHLSTAALSHPGGSGAALTGHVYDQLYTVNRAGISYSNTYGFGRANARAAVELAQAYDFPLGRYTETIDPVTGMWQYRSGLINLIIPDHSATGVSHRLSVNHELKIESVQLRMTTDHPYLGDLGVELISPGGTRSRLLLINSNIAHSGLKDYQLLTNAFYGEHSKGEWTIRVIDGSLQDTGRLNSWQLKINGAEVGE
jgi:subtilisin-like proprotein convertase family protein